MEQKESLDTLHLAAFRMRCWYEMGDKLHPHYVEDYRQLADDSEQMRKAILPHLSKNLSISRLHSETFVNSQAELLITVLLAEYYCQQFDSDLLSSLLVRANALVPWITNRQLLCYLLVLLFFFEDNPAKTMKSRIDGLMAMWKQKDITLEDEHLRKLYRAKLENLRYFRTA